MSTLVSVPSCLESASGSLADLVRQLEWCIRVRELTERLTALLRTVDPVRAEITKDGPIPLGGGYEEPEGEDALQVIYLDAEGLTLEGVKPLTVEQAAALPVLDLDEIERSLTMAVQRALARCH